MRSLLLSVLVLLSACNHWVAYDRAPGTLLAPALKPASTLRVTLLTGDRVVVNNAAIRDGMLSGTQGCEYQPCRDLGRVSFPLTSLRQIEIRRTDVQGTAIVLAGLGGAVAFVATMLAWEDYWKP